MEPYTSEGDENFISDCCNSEMIPPDFEAADNAGSLYRAFLCYICKKCGKVCEPIEKQNHHN